MNYALILFFKKLSILPSSFFLRNDSHSFFNQKLRKTVQSVFHFFEIYILLTIRTTLFLKKNDATSTLNQFELLGLLFSNIQQHIATPLLIRHKS
jgi:hypothetical protein